MPGLPLSQPAYCWEGLAIYWHICVACLPGMWIADAGGIAASAAIETLRSSTEDTPLPATSLQGWRGGPCLGNSLGVLLCAIDLVDQGQGVVPKVGVLHGLRVDAVQGDEGDAPGPLLREQGGYPGRHVIVVHHHVKQLVAGRHLRIASILLGQSSQNVLRGTENLTCSGSTL